MKGLSSYKVISSVEYLNYYENEKLSLCQIYFPYDCRISSIQNKRYNYIDLEYLSKRNNNLNKLKPRRIMMPLSIASIGKKSKNISTKNIFKKKKGNFIMFNKKYIISNLERTLMTKAEETAYNFITNNMKNHFGKEMSFRNSEDSIIIDTIVNNFIKKYDKHFKNHTTKKNYKDLLMLKDTHFIIILEKNTFMYVASGTKMGKIEERYFMGGISSSDLYLYICGKHTYKYISELDKMIEKISTNKSLGMYIIDASNNMYGYGDEKGKCPESLDVLYSKLQPRFMDTLFFSFNEKEDVCNHIDKFISNEEFYKERYLLYKTGILLYGEHGTGKSSFVKALACQYGRSIATINISNMKYIDLNKLTESINVDETQKYIVLLEDIDTLFLNRTDGESSKEDQAIINKLLQFLDSNTSPNNVIFIATTNHVDRLDEALLRCGRFDLKVNMKALNAEGAIKFGKSFGLKESQINEVIKDMRDEAQDKNCLFNQSKLQTKFLSKVENKSVEEIEKIYGSDEE